MIRTLARSAVVAAVGIGLAAGVAVVPAQAATPARATLGVVSEGGGSYWIPVNGVFPMSKAAAQDAINHGYHVELRLWGDDPSSDNLRFTYPNAILSAENDGLHFSRSARVSHNVLNEDSGWYEGDGDELYVGARAVASNGHISLTVQSNTVSGYY